MSKPPRIVSSGRFMIAHGDDGSGVYDIRGGAHPYTYKTFRNAVREIRAYRFGVGVVLLWDPSLLPIVAADDLLVEHPNLSDQMSEIEFCDRQIQLWADRANRVRAGERVDLARSLPESEYVE